MRIVFDSSYVALCVLVLLEGLYFRTVLRKVAAMKRVRAILKAEAPPKLAAGQLSPQFSVPLVDSEISLSTADLKGHETILMFVNSRDGLRVPHGQLATALHALWHKVNGKLFVLCNGDMQGCLKFAESVQIGWLPVPFALDEGGDVARRFLIETTPAAVELDEDLRIVRYGTPSSSAHMQGTVQLDLN